MIITARMMISTNATKTEELSLRGRITPYSKEKPRLISNIRGGMRKMEDFYNFEDEQQQPGGGNDEKEDFNAFDEDSSTASSEGNSHGGKKNDDKHSGDVSESTYDSGYDNGSSYDSNSNSNSGSYDSYSSGSSYDSNSNSNSGSYDSYSSGSGSGSDYDSYSSGSSSYDSSGSSSYDSSGSSSYDSSSYDSSSSSSSSGGSYSSYHAPSKFWKFLKKINVKVPLLPTLIVAGIFIYAGMVCTAFMYQVYPESIFTNCCRLSISTAKSCSSITFNIYHCRLGEIPPIVCAMDDDDDLSDDELERMKPRPKLENALNVEHEKCMARGNSTDTGGLLPDSKEHTYFGLKLFG